MIYTFAQWLFIFYFYCFIGWVWETMYVSVCHGEWINRGFMHGPFLPIYGSGAVAILLFTLNFRENAVAVFFVGMLAATVLEYFTGAAMEKLFHVRYWDYTKEKFNLNGHICVKCSLCWGFFSVILTLYGHTPLEHMVLSMNSNVLEFFTFLLTAYISVDMTASVREALNLKEMLLNLEENNENFRNIQKKMESFSNVYGVEIKEKSEAGLKKINSVIENGKQMQAKHAAKSRKRKAATKNAFLSNIEKSRRLKDEAFSKVAEVMEACADKAKSLVDGDKMLEEADDIKSTVLRQKGNNAGLRSKDYIRISKLLKRNPDAVSMMHEQAFTEIIGLTQDDEEESGSEK